jgi:hypothetical protein
MSVFPLQTNGNVNIRFAHPQPLRAIEVSDMQGRIVERVPITGATNGGQAVDLGHLDRGSYLLRAVMPNGNLVSRVVVQ